MGRIIDKKTANEINNGLKINYATGVNQNSYSLPKFKQNENGEYEFAGTVKVSNLKEYNSYIKTYNAIAKYIKENYGSTISRIYKNALNSLVSAKDPYVVPRNKYSISSKLANKLFSTGKVESEGLQTYSDTLNFVTKAAYNTKRLKPASEIKDIMKIGNRDFSESQEICVLPQIGENGVILHKNKNNTNALEANFELLSRDEINAIENYMIQTADSLDPETAKNVKTQINKIFSASRNIGSKINQGTADVVSDLQKLTKNLIDLVGADLSEFSKSSKKTKKVAKSEIKDLDEEDYEISNEELEAKESTPSNFSADEIVIRGTYRTTPSVQGDVIVSKLSPDGKKFKVSFDKNKLFVVNEKENDENSFSF